MYCQKLGFQLPVLSKELSSTSWVVFSCGLKTTMSPTSLRVLPRLEIGALIVTGKVRCKYLQHNLAVNS